MKVLAIMLLVVCCGCGASNLEKENTKLRWQLQQYHEVIEVWRDQAKKAHADYMELGTEYIKLQEQIKSTN